MFARSGTRAHRQPLQLCSFWFAQTTDGVTSVVGMAKKILFHALGVLGAAPEALRTALVGGDDLEVNKLNH